MQYLNVNLSGLRGKHHPSLSSIVTTDEVRKLRPHLKFLSGDYLTYQVKFEQTQKGSPLCKICSLDNETVCHIITICPEYDEMRKRILLSPSLQVDFQSLVNNPETHTQFLLDPTSFNLEHRVHRNDPIVHHLFKISRDLCYSIHNRRMKKLLQLSKEKTNNK